MRHTELYEVITSRDGSSNLSFKLACATPAEHYARTITSTAAVVRSSSSSSIRSGNEDSKDNGIATIQDVEECCATGLRVYEGAQVLAAFLVQYGLALLPPRASRDENRVDGGKVCSSHERRTVVELGCGCGLVGLTAAHVYSQAATTVQLRKEEAEDVTVVFTDASRDCLALVRESGGAMGLDVVDGETAGNLLTIKSPTHMATFPLLWSSQGVQALLQTLNASASSAASSSSCAAGGVTGERAVTRNAAGVDLILGSDILYYRVDVQALLMTCKQLLCSSSSAFHMRFVVFSHFMRIPGGYRKVASAARGMGLGIARVPLAAIFDKAVITSRGFAGMEVALLFVSKIAKEQHRESTAVTALEDVECVRRALAARIAEAVEGVDTEQLRSLSEHLVPYTDEREDVSALLEPAKEEEELMHMFMQSDE